MKAPLIYYPAPEKALTNEEINHIFGLFAPTDPIMVAFRQILVERLVLATVDAVEPSLTERTAGMVAGRIQEISSLQQELADFFKAGAALRHARGVEPVKPIIKKTK
jgi:hypothetical protein